MKRYQVALIKEDMGFATVVEDVAWVSARTIEKAARKYAHQRGLTSKTLSVRTERAIQQAKGPAIPTWKVLV